MSVRAIYFDERNIGERIKKSKKQFIWKFEIDGLQHTIEFLVSKLSGKKKVIQDGVVLLEQKKITKSFEFPFNIGKHMLVITYGLKGGDLRIDNNSFENLYQGKSYSGTDVKPSYGKPQAPAQRSQTQYNPQKKKMPEGWQDIKKAKDGLKYDDIPDPYSDQPAKKKEEKKSLQELGRPKKAGTVFQKKKKSSFDDDFDWGDADKVNIEI
jgi:hypothetical protein